MPYDLMPFWLTLKLAAVTTVILLAVGIPLAYWLAFTRSRWGSIIEAIVSLPLVLPPTVIGFYLLVALSPVSAAGKVFESIFQVQAVFSFTGLVIGSVLFSLPFLVNPVKSGFQTVPQALIDAAQTLGKSRRETLCRVLLPFIRPSLITGAVMAFAHTLGEFGVVLMIGGNIPGQTRTASIAIFSEVEALNYHAANFYALTTLGVSFCLLFGLYWTNRRAMRGTV